MVIYLLLKIIKSLLQNCNVLCTSLSLMLFSFGIIRKFLTLCLFQICEIFLISLQVSDCYLDRTLHCGNKDGDQMSYSCQIRFYEYKLQKKGGCSITYIHWFSCRHDKHPNNEKNHCYVLSLYYIHP